MIRLTIILIGLQFLTCSVKAQTKDSTDWGRGLEHMDKFYIKNSPLDYLSFLKSDFKRKNRFNIFVVMPSPDNWVKAEHIPGLMKLIYSTDSTKSIMNALSSELTSNKFSSVGREAQNLIECFREKKSYPDFLNSFGPPDKIKGKEIEIWLTKYKSEKP